jgi:hypothetical protein
MSFKNGDQRTKSYDTVKGVPSAVYTFTFSTVFAADVIFAKIELCACTH